MNHKFKWFTCIIYLIPHLLCSLPRDSWFEFSATRFRAVLQPARLEPLHRLLKRFPVGALTRKLGLILAGSKGKMPVVSFHNQALMQVSSSLVQKMYKSPHSRSFLLFCSCERDDDDVVVWYCSSASPSAHPELKMGSWGITGSFLYVLRMCAPFLAFLWKYQAFESDFNTNNLPDVVKARDMWFRSRKRSLVVVFVILEGKCYKPETSQE